MSSLVADCCWICTYFNSEYGVDDYHCAKGHFNNGWDDELTDPLTNRCVGDFKVIEKIKRYRPPPVRRHTMKNQPAYSEGARDVQAHRERRLRGNE